MTTEVKPTYDGLRIGYWVSPRLQEKKWFKEMLKEANSLRVEFIDFDMTKELPLRQIDALFWKSPPRYDSSDESDKITVRRFTDYISTHPWVHLVGPTDGTTNYRDQMKQFFSDLSLKIGDHVQIRQPAWQFIRPTDPSTVNLTYPLVAKPLNALSHNIALIYNEKGLKEYRASSPSESFTLEEFKNHDGLMHKLYFLGKKCWVYYRKSFANISSLAENGKNYEIPETRVSQEVPANIEELPIPNPLPEEAINEIIKYIGIKNPSLSMFGIDIIQDVVSKVYYIIDINFAPSYAEVPNGPSLLLNHLLTGTVQRTNRPHNNTVFLPESRNSSTFSRDTTIVVFDIDGTLTENGRVITEEVKQLLQKLRQIATVGVISGGTLDQVGFRLGTNFMNEYDFIFAENSCQTYHQTKLVDPFDMESILTRKELMELINWALIYIANLDLPLKRGNFIDYRNSLINISPAGRWISEDTSAREEWIAFDKKNGIRKKMVDDMKKKFDHWDKLSWVIGGNSGFDVFPRGWDKSLVHRFTANYKHYYYFGDRTDPALFGNDWLCFSHPTSFGFSVKDPQDTINIVKNCFCLSD